MSQAGPESPGGSRRARAGGRIVKRAPDAAETPPGSVRYNSLFRDSADVMLVIDPADGRILDANVAASEFYGYSHDQLVGRSIVEINADPPDRTKRNMSRAVTGSQRFFHFQHRLASGEIRDVEVSSSRVESDGRTVLLSIVHDVSERVAGERALRSSEALLGRAESIAHVGSWRLDLATGTVVWSAEMARIFDTNPAAIGFDAAAAIDQAVHPDDRARLNAVNSASLADGVPRTAEYRILRTDGSVRWVHAEGERETDESGRVVALIGFVQDITEGKHAEDALRQSEAKHRTVIEQSPIPIAAHRAGRAVFANAAHRAMFRYADDQELASLDLADLVAPESREMVRRYVERRALDLESIDEYEFVGLRRDGTTFPALVKSVPIDLPDGPATLVFHIDLTELRRTGEALRAAEERFTTAFRSAPVMVTLQDMTGLFLDINDEALRVAGFSRDEVIGHTALETGWISPDNRQRLHEEIRTKGRIAGMEMEFRAKDGRTIVCLVSGEPIQMLGRQCLAIVSIDITDRRRIEDERERLQAELAQSQKMEAVGRLAGGVAHDFNNLLTAIGGYARILEDGLATGAADPADAAEIRSAADRASALTAKLLAFSGRNSAAASTIDLAAAVNQILPILRRIVPERIEITAELLPGLQVHGDPTELDRVIVNLVVNAADAMPAIGRITIGTCAVDHDPEFVRGRLNARPGPHARLTVSDIGSGMDEGTRARIFEPFFTTKPAGQGTGLGLATVYGVVERMGGTIEVRSAPGLGSVFEIDLPASPPPVGLAAECPEQASAPGTERVLLVEDEPIVRKFVSGALARLGYRVIATENPAEATKVPGADYDLVITDVVMPGMDGTELARTLRRNRPELPILFVSGYSQGIAWGGALAEPRTGMLSKPFTPSELAGAVRKLLDDTGAG
jgi:two-component system cell cycle sensor histidine kinase/response regulator CckA